MEQGEAKQQNKIEKNVRISVSGEGHMAEQPAFHRSENFSTKNFVIPLIFLKSDDIITRERFWSELFLYTKT